MAEIIVGIDLGTTNSEVAAFLDGKPQIIGNASRLMLPSCVGIAPNGDLLIGEAARNQMLLYPERTVRSVKRLMGSDERVTLGKRTFSPPEISALILRELARWASVQLNEPVKKAVITVPAYFSDAQRNATREAGELAGLEVVRIVNEPTAASLAYGMDQGANRTVMIYDLGGGTLDVSIVRIDGEVTEVLASHGNNRLGGDDFDQKLVDHLVDAFRGQHDVDIRANHPAAYARLWWAAEEAKKQLSSEPYARIREESLVQVAGRPLHLEVEISRNDYEGMIRSLVEKTLESVSRALSDAGVRATDLDAILLVGGSTRTPLVVEMLQDLCGKEPRQDLHPDLCVALGAGVLASRLSGHDVERVLVDVSPFSFGPSYLGERGGYEYNHCYRPIIKRNTPLPVTRSDEYGTVSDYQTTIQFEIYQGEDPDALRNVHVGNFRIEGLKPVPAPNSVLCKMRLDVDGILHVTAIEKATGLSKHIAISGATRTRSAEEVARSRKALEGLWSRRLDASEDLIDSELIESDDDESGESADAAEVFVSEANVQSNGSGAGPLLEKPLTEAQSLIIRCRQRIGEMHLDDKEEAIGLIEQIQEAADARDVKALDTALKSMSEFLFFIEGK